uniref:GRAS family transcription factor containing protein n=2 Tax=Oryza sativa subsp. japonica TaxID=39947 RepID=Q2RAS6_ORYSJ|nr:GRAS family transcription factor containing protein [Oryza sativa Japonica Group]
MAGIAALANCQSDERSSSCGAALLEFMGPAAPPSEAAAAADDVVLPYISRILMEEDIDDDMFFCLYPDHPALLEAQQPFAQILSSSSSIAGEVNSAPMEDSAALMMQGSGNGRGRKGSKHGGDELEAEVGRASKLMATPEEEEDDDDGVGEMLEKMMLNGDEDEAFHGETNAPRVPAEKKCGKAARRRRRQAKGEVVDLRELLMSCAQAVASGNRRSAGELLEQIKRHSSPTGDATERLAHYFADGLEARLAGAASLERRLVASAEERASAMELLEAYQVFMAACCFKWVAFTFANMAILRAAEGRNRLHIVDYGGQYHGLQWPSLLQRLAEREGGPPEFRAVAAARWETVTAEDVVGVDPDDEAAVVVNDVLSLGTLMDESGVFDDPSPRDTVLGSIRDMRPAVFVQAVVNGAHGAPFFPTRFREALFFFSALFDMLGATTPEEGSHLRVVLERDVLRRAAVGVIAGEGAERVERPETYRRWQARNRRAGLRQAAVEGDVVEAVRRRVRRRHHEEFVIEEDAGWLLQGWKGRILYAHSAWVVAEDGAH